jgi:hypothetical protein
MSNSATSSTSTAIAVPSIFIVPVSKKLIKTNSPLWSAQLLPAIRAAQLDDLLTGAVLPLEKELTMVVDDKPVKKHNPVYSAWVAQNQAVLRYLLSTLTRETL